MHKKVLKIKKNIIYNCSKCSKLNYFIKKVSVNGKNCDGGKRIALGYGIYVNHEKIMCYFL